MTSYNIILTGIATLLAIYCLYLRRTIARLKSDMQPVSEHRLMVSNNNIMDVIKKTADHMRPQMERHQIQFSVKCTPDSMMGWIDTYVVSQIVTGILTASAKNTERTGSIQLSVTTSKFYDFININLTDSGITAPPSETDDTLRLIHLHHGTLTTDDTVYGSCTITIELPINKEAFEDYELVQVNASPFHIPANIPVNEPISLLPTTAAVTEEHLEEIKQETPSADHEFLQRAIRCINEHMMDTDYDRDTFASDMGCSVSTLYNKIRKLTGKSVTDFSRDIRIKKACQLAKENHDLRVSDIAYQVGFKDPKYFATSFKRVMGTQPKEYFAEVRGEK